MKESIKNKEAVSISSNTANDLGAVACAGCPMLRLGCRGKSSTSENCPANIQDAIDVDLNEKYRRELLEDNNINMVVAKSRRKDASQAIPIVKVDVNRNHSADISYPKVVKKTTHKENLMNGEKIRNDIADILVTALGRNALKYTSAKNR